MRRVYACVCEPMAPAGEGAPEAIYSVFINTGDHICDIETDKATIAWESQEDGYIAKILVEEGAGDIPVGKTVLVVCDEQADVAAVSDPAAISNTSVLHACIGDIDRFENVLRAFPSQPGLMLLVRYLQPAV